MSTTGNPAPQMNMGGGDELSLTKTGLKIAMIKIAAYEARIAELEAAALPPQTKMTVADFATRLFDLHGFMLLETYRGKHAVTVTFPDLQEAQQFHNALIELSQHRVTPRTLEGKTDA